jgi:hypothetical protein
MHRHRAPGSRDLDKLMRTLRSGSDRRDVGYRQRRLPNSRSQFGGYRVRREWQVEPDASRARTAGNVECGTYEAGAFLHSRQPKAALAGVRSIESAAVIDHL